MLICNNLMKQAAMREYQISFYEFSVRPHSFYFEARVSDLLKHTDPFVPKLVLSPPQSDTGKTFGRTEQCGFEVMNVRPCRSTKRKENVLTIPKL